MISKPNVVKLIGVKANMHWERFKVRMAREPRMRLILKRGFLRQAPFKRIAWFSANNKPRRMIKVRM